MIFQIDKNLRYLQANREELAKGIATPLAPARFYRVEKRYKLEVKII